MPPAGRTLLGLPKADTAELVETVRSLPARQFRGSPRAKALFDRLLELHARPPTVLRQTRMRLAVLELLLEIIDSGARHAAGDAGAIVREVVQIIQSRPKEEFRIEDLARIAGYSLSWFKTRFKEETGISPRQFILRTKIEMACRRLTSGNDPIGKIAGDLGFPRRSISPRSFAA